MQMDGFLTLKGGNVELVGAPETIFVLPIGHVVSSKGEFDVCLLYTSPSPRDV